MTSSRLPGKVLTPVGGRPMLAQQLRRLGRCQRADEIVVATTTNATDDPVVALVEAEGLRWFRGSEADVLARYVGAAREAGAEIVVRITADCPLIDPAETDRVIAALEEHAAECDYAANVVRRTLPFGLDSEALFRDTLERVDRLGRSAPAREHVTHFILREHPELFLVQSVEGEEDHSSLRWTVDTADDLTLVQRLYEDLGLGERSLGYRDIVDHVTAHPELLAINAHVRQKAF